jgi:hypothetical protein
MRLMYEAVHWLPLAPAAVLIVRRREHPAVYWLVALAFATAVVHDGFAFVTGGSWEGVAYWMLAQFGLLLLAFGGVLVALAYVVASCGLWLAGPEVIAILGTAAVLGLSVRHELAWAMLIYCGLGTLAYLAMAAEWQGVFMPWWGAYQTARLGAFGLFARAAWRANA